MYTIKSKFLIFHASAGSGHTMCARAIAAGLRHAGVDEEAIFVCDAAGLSTNSTAVMRNFYMKIMSAAPWLFEAFYRVGDTKIGMWIFDLILRFLDIDIINVIEREKPDVIVSTFNMVSMMCARLKRQGKLNIPVVSVMTDVIGHYVYVSEGIDCYWVMNDASAQSLIDRGVDPKLIQAKGIPFDERFVMQVRRNKAELRTRLNMPADRFTLLVSHWVIDTTLLENILRALEPLADSVAVFVLCGHRDEVKRALEAKEYPYPVRFFGFIDFMPDLMEASDLIIGKVGGLTVVESLAKEVPMIIFNPVYGQERGNADFLVTNNAAFLVDSPEDVHAIVESALRDPNYLAQRRKAISAIAKPHATRDMVDYLLNKI